MENMKWLCTNSFTNHCGVIDFKGKSYFVYHTGWLPGGGGFTRSVCIEEFKYNEDGTIPTIMATKKGVAPIGTLNPYLKTEAETMAWGLGLKTDQGSNTGVYVTSIRNGGQLKVREDTSLRTRFLCALRKTSCYGQIQETCIWWRPQPRHPSDEPAPRVPRWQLV